MLRNIVFGLLRNMSPGENQKHVTVLFFGAARDAAGEPELKISLHAQTAGAAFTELLENFPGLKRFGRSLLFAVNQEYAAPDLLLKDGDELALFPPVSGGGPADSTYRHDFFELTTEPIDVGAVARRVVLPECGATVTLDGYAREWTAGRRTLYLIYEAYAPMALSELGRLAQRAHEQFEIAHLGVVHRTGRLEI
ncbi:MAG TPA: molybdenum cofactor biosynthesis protein MoaE, partial [Pyrinomonadaceae bacterium]|nr:molybdenum cofactor biosynthesis protein MoaE [Pyrinomonadaceae bacterium]